MAQEETVPHSVMAELLHEAEQASLKSKGFDPSVSYPLPGRHPVKRTGFHREFAKGDPGAGPSA